MPVRDGTQPLTAAEQPWRSLRAWLVTLTGFGLLGAGCLLWSALALPFRLALPRCRGARLGRLAAMYGFRIYLVLLRLLGAARFDLRSLDALRDAGPLILAANHPGLLDAPMIVSRLPNVVCILKAALIDNPLWGNGAQLACYIRNDWFMGSVHRAVDVLQRGSQLLLFPEGSRTENLPLDPFLSGVAIVSHRSGVPVQTLLIEQDTRFLGKGLPLFSRPDMPMHFRIRLGRRFDPPQDPRQFTRALHDYFLQELEPSAIACHDRSQPDPSGLDPQLQSR